jgi:DNA-binding NarL/FixJ family response regulator
MGRVLSRLCLYGTVLNSADTVERSIRSVFRPDADIVITDGGLEGRDLREAARDIKGLQPEGLQGPRLEQGPGEAAGVNKVP